MDQRRDAEARHAGFCTPGCPDDCVGGTGDTSNMGSNEQVRWTETAVDLLTVLAEGRAEYFHGKEPEHQGDLRSMRFDELILWSEREAARQIRDIIAGTNDGKGWMPSWRWDELERALARVRGEKVTGG